MCPDSFICIAIPPPSASGKNKLRQELGVTKGDCKYSKQQDACTASERHLCNAEALYMENINLLYFNLLNLTCFYKTSFTLLPILQMRALESDTKCLAQHYTATGRGRLTPEL